MNKIVPAIKVRQWMKGWNKIDFDATQRRAKPPEHFYMFTMPARELRSLSGIKRRSARGILPRTKDLGIQRQHDEERSEEIGRFVEFGYPWSTLSESKRASPDFNDLRKPGWLPTAIVLNILKTDDRRPDVALNADDVVQVNEKGGQCFLTLPYETWSNKWAPKGMPPFEIIDGQHRLWAFDGSDVLGDFDLPVVAFVGLDISWQAYLFWTINIKPKRINSSLAFDLYPLLRSEEWLDRAEGHAVYRETRAQELVEAIWSYPQSAWYDRINMLGERENPWVSQNAWIRSLVATFIKPWDRRGRATGGLFGGRSRGLEEVLGWNRSQQAAFLILSWNVFRDNVKRNESKWCLGLRKNDSVGNNIDDPAFYGPFSLIATDQGVRGYLQVINDICYVRASQLQLHSWLPDVGASSVLVEAVESVMSTVKKQKFAQFLDDVSRSLAGFDWRTSSAPNLTETERRAKLVFRGSGGYRELRSQLLEYLATADGQIGEAANTLLSDW